MISPDAIFQSIRQLRSKTDSNPEVSKIIDQLEKNIQDDDYSKLAAAMQTIMSEREREMAAIAVLLNDASSVDDRKVAEAELNLIFNRMWSQIEAIPEMMAILLHIVCLDQSGVYRKRYPSVLGVVAQALDTYDKKSYADNAGRIADLKAIRGNLTVGIAPFKTIARFAHDTFPFGLSRLVKYKNRYHIVKQMYPYDDDHYDGRLELEDVISGRRLFVGHALHRSNVRYAREIRDDFNNIACNASGSEGYTWETGCDALGYNTMSRTKRIASHEERECKKFIAEAYPDYPEHHLKLALCQELLRTHHI